ncbi:hypothetical protein HELRODRAFT_170025 [Helobdella robusta]|uniref:Uncharacterized protein n=1 Tax=Helobdella robusta TaxID=6412 RepID=T1F2K0_HELRO|nr:hypothetical protein HELRODRAFT_170025 [Helobdella robusta]ESO07491.1 hypothetical protein HELRODRAFT_170025 [Helobdella robusta]
MGTVREVLPNFCGTPAHRPIDVPFIYCPSPSRVEAENLKVLENIKLLYSVKELVNSKKSLISHVESLLESEKLKLVPHGNTKDAEIQEIFQVIDFVYLNKLEYKLPIYAAVNLKKVPCFAAGLKHNDENSKDEKIQQQLHEIKGQLNTVSLGINKQNMLYLAVTAKNVNPKLNEIQSPRSLSRNPAVRMQIPPTAQHHQQHPSSSLGPLTHQQHQSPSAIQQENPFSIVSKKKRQIKNIRGTNSTGMCPKSAGAIVKKKFTL